MVSPDSLREMMERFINDEDRSLSLAGEIEAGLADVFGEQEPFAELSLALASYRPGGGEYLYDERHVVALMKRVIQEMTSPSKRGSES